MIKKNELIEKLNAIKGNPEVVFWGDNCVDYLDIEDVREAPMWTWDTDWFVPSTVVALYQRKRAL